MRTLLFLLLLCGAFFLYAQDLPTTQIEDDSLLRLEIASSWFTELPLNLLGKEPELYTLRGGSRIQVRLERSAQNRDEFAVVLARERNGIFPGWAQGSWVLTRRWDNDESGQRIRYFPRSDANVYVQFRPLSDDRSQMDVVLYDAHDKQSLPIPLPFPRLVILPVEDAFAVAGSRFPRRYFDPEPGLYRDVRAFAAEVRERLTDLVYVDDGAMDEDGNFVFIENFRLQNELSPWAGFNCSGFAKWVIDGILRPITGKRLPIAGLKAPFTDRSGSSIEPWEESRDPFFGLDWIRNLAAEALAMLRSPNVTSLNEIEVQASPFAQIIVRQGTERLIRPYQGFLENAGFATEGLIPLLYTLAIDEPGRIFLAAVNDEFGAPVTAENPRGLPRLRQFYHIGVLVPYFNDQGIFQVAVFESAAETSIARFRNRYPGQFVNLVRVPVEDRFDP